MSDPVFTCSAYFLAKKKFIKGAEERDLKKRLLAEHNISPAHFEEKLKEIAATSTSASTSVSKSSGGLKGPSAKRARNAVALATSMAPEPREAPSGSRDRANPETASARAPSSGDELLRSSLRQAAGEIPEEFAPPVTKAEPFQFAEVVPAAVEGWETYLEWKINMLSRVGMEPEPVADYRKFLIRESETEVQGP